MKKLFVSMILTLLSSQSFASSSCDKNALELAKNNLDQKARAYGFESSDLDDGSLKLINEEATTGNLTFTVDGYIYKASYTVKVSVDSSCGLESLSIKENL